MLFFQATPSAALQDFVKCYWMAEGTDKNVSKIIPDGHAELIFHYGDSYLIQSDNTWHKQANTLIAGQLTQPIRLKPTGSSAVFGIKFRPTALWRIFGCNMKELRNQSVAADDILHIHHDRIVMQLAEPNSFQARVSVTERYLLGLIQNARTTAVDHLIGEIQRHDGNISPAHLAISSRVSSRKIERMFNEQVGVSAKVYSRLVRFNKVFSLLEQKDLSKAEASYLCGYFDQAHFNKEFKSFTGEDAVNYFRQSHHFANFFMK